MDGFVRAITKSNVDKLIVDYLTLVETVGASVAGVSGVRLLKALKRDRVKVGPYPHVTLFEAANRIMTDLVILYGVKWVLSTNAFPFETYNVERERRQPRLDLRASSNGRELVGEAFNVAPSFFQLKKTDDLGVLVLGRPFGPKVVRALGVVDGKPLLATVQRGRWSLIERRNGPESSSSPPDSRANAIHLAEAFQT